MYSLVKCDRLHIRRASIENAADVTKTRFSPLFFQMAAKFIVFALLFGCSYASPLYAVSVFVQDLDEPREIDEWPMYALNDDSVDVAKHTANSLDIEKRNAARGVDEDNEDDDDDDLETAAGSNVLRPLFVYRQQVAYRQRVREAIRKRGRRI